MVSRLLIALCLTKSTLITGCAQPRFRAELFDSSATAPYRLASGDRLRIIVFGQDSLERVDIHRVQICALTIDSMDMNALGVCS